MSFAMIGIVLVVAAAIVAIAYIAGGSRAARITGAAIGGWLALTGALAAAGVLRLDGGPPRIMVLPPLAVIGSVLALRRVPLDAIPRGAVIALQSFRIAVELVLWRLFVAGVVPIQMTFEGRNFDIAVGLTAIPIAIAAYGGGRRRTRLAAAWHLASLALLLNIVAIAVTSTPGPLRMFANEPANTFVGTFPFVWLPAFLVPVAAVGHIIGLRQASAASAASTSARGAAPSPRRS